MNANARWCTWHAGPAEGTALINIIETGSGPGGMQYACPACRDTYGLTPLVDPPAQGPDEHRPGPTGGGA